MKKKLIFITGGVRSGKSQFALEMGELFPGPKVYLATAQALDEEMRQRISQHKASRPPEWQTIEEPIQIVSALHEKGEKFQLLLLDCLTLWVSNMLMAGWSKEKILAEMDKLLRVYQETKCSVIIVSNEVGWGIVPDNELARIFRDLIGLIHQKIGQKADEVYLMICGLPHKLKGGQGGK